MRKKGWRPPPVLELYSPDLNNPSSLDLAAVESMMLWADDEVSRQLAMQYRVLETGLEHMRAGELSPAETMEWAEEAFRILPRTGTILEQKKKRIGWGLNAGLILFKAVYLGQTDPEKVAIGDL